MTKNHNFFKLPICAGLMMPEEWQLLIFAMIFNCTQVDVLQQCENTNSELLT